MNSATHIYCTKSSTIKLYGAKDGMLVVRNDSVLLSGYVYFLPALDYYARPPIIVHVGN